jgi:UPF0755 protein
MLIVLSGWYIYHLNQDIEVIFGPASDQLTLKKQILLATQLYLHTSELTKPIDPLGSEQTFVVQSGQSTADITKELKKQGLIRDTNAFNTFLEYSGLDRSIQAGVYQLSARMNAIEIAYALQDATPSEIVFQILAGWRLEEIAASIPTSGLEFSPDAFLTTVYYPNESLSIIESIPDGVSLEGFLYPDSYQLARDISINEFLNTVLLDFQIKVDQSIQDGFRDQEVTLYQAVTIASLVEREAMVSEEMPIIASVFINRLRNGMKLDSDASVQYALGYQTDQKTWWKNPLNLDDLQIDSPYNTYRYQGLPPGPICNPSVNAMRAVAFPADTPYYYFRATCDGSGNHTFSVTFEEHSAKTCPPENQP